MNAVIYARYSSSNQREESIEDQMRVCNAYAQREGLRVIQEYSDFAMTGTNDRRPAFQQMIEDSARKGFEHVIIYKVNRFARDRLDALKYRMILKKNGVKLVSATETIPDTPEGILLESILDAVAEMESRYNSQGVKRALEGNALKCKPSGVTLFGYKIVDKEYYEIDPVTGPLVKMIFEGYADGKATAEICAELNKTGVKTRRGKTWGKTNLQAIIANEKYTGVYKFCGHRVEGGMPAIVSRELFDKVQNRKRRKMTKAHSYLLTGKLFCDECGERMMGKAGTGRDGTTHHYYTCWGHINHKCDKSSVRQDVLEDAVFNASMAILNDDRTLKAIADKVFTYQKEINDLSRLKMLEKSRRKVKNQIEKCKNLIVDADSPEVIVRHMGDKLVELEQELSNLNAAVAKEAAKSVEVTHEFITYWLMQFRENETDADTRKAVLETFVNSAKIDEKGNLTIEYNYSDDNGSNASSRDSVDNLRFASEQNGGMYGT